MIFRCHTWQSAVRVSHVDQDSCCIHNKNAKIPKTQIHEIISKITCRKLINFPKVKKHKCSYLADAKLLFSAVILNAFLALVLTLNRNNKNILKIKLEKTHGHTPAIRTSQYSQSSKGVLADQGKSENFGISLSGWPNKMTTRIRRKKSTLTELKIAVVGAPSVGKSGKTPTDHSKCLA